MGDDDTQKDAKTTRAAARTAPAAPADPPATEPVEEERRYNVDELVAASRVLLGCSPHAAVGALSQSDRKTHTQDQAQALVKQFMKLEVS